MVGGGGGGGGGVVVGGWKTIQDQSLWGGSSLWGSSISLRLMCLINVYAVLYMCVYVVPRRRDTTQMKLKI